MDATWQCGCVGRLTSGPHAGYYVQVEQDASCTGFHIWLLRRHPSEGPSEGWDIWADDEAQVDEWFSGGLVSVKWVG